MHVCISRPRLIFHASHPIRSVPPAHPTTTTTPLPHSFQFSSHFYSSSFFFFFFYAQHTKHSILAVSAVAEIAVNEKRSPLSSLFCHYYLRAVYKRAVTLLADNAQEANAADELSIQQSPHNTSIGGADLRKKGKGRGLEQRERQKKPWTPCDRQAGPARAEYPVNLQPGPPWNTASRTPDSLPAAAVSYLASSSSASEITIILLYAVFSTLRTPSLSPPRSWHPPVPNTATINLHQSRSSTKPRQTRIQALTHQQRNLSAGCSKRLSAQSR